MTSYACGSDAFGQLSGTENAEKLVHHALTKVDIPGPSWRVCAANWTQTVFHSHTREAHHYLLYGLSPVPQGQDKGKGKQAEGEDDESIVGRFVLRTPSEFRCFLGSDQFEALLDGKGRARAFGSLPWTRYDTSDPEIADGVDLIELDAVSAGRTWKTAAADELGRVIAVEERSGSVHLFKSVKQFVAHTGDQSMTFAEDPSSPSRPREVVQVCAGASHFIVLTRPAATGVLDHQLWGWGDDRFGQLQLDLPHAGPKATSTPPPVLHPITFFSPLAEGFPETVTAIAAGGRHSVCVTGSGAAYVWGANDKGQLGIRGTKSASVTLVELDTSAGKDAMRPETSAAARLEDEDDEHTNVTMIACGSSHTALATADGTLWVAGSNADGQLGLGQEAASTKTGVDAALLPKPAWGAGRSRDDDSDKSAVFRPLRAPISEQKLVALACGASHIVLSFQ